MAPKDPKPEPKLCNCSWQVGPSGGHDRVPSGNCPMHGSN
jgi:hypothetical protein